MASSQASQAASSQAASSQAISKAASRKAVSSKAGRGLQASQAASSQAISKAASSKASRGLQARQAAKTSKQQRQREASQPAGRQASQCAHVVYWGARTVPAHEGIFPNPRGRTGQKMPDGNQALIRAKIVDGILADGTLTLFAEKSRSKRMNEMPCWRVANKAVY